MKSSIAQNRFCFTRLAEPLLILACVFFTFATSGCATLMLAPRFNAADHRFELDRPYGSPVLSANASQILRENAIPTPSNVDELSKLRALVDMSATPDLVYAYAETAYLQARKLEKSHPLQAQRLYADVMLFSWHFLFNPALSNAHDRATWNGQLADVSVGGRPVVPNRTYTLATSDYMTGGADHMTALTRYTKYWDSQLLIRDLYIQAAQKQDTLRATVDGRVTIL